MSARILAVAALVAMTLVGTAPAQSTPDLQLRKVSAPPASVQATGSFNLKVRVKNVGDAGRAGLLTMTLQDGPAGYSVPRRIGRIPVSELDPGSFRRYRVRLTIPPSAKAGRYRLKTCLRAQGRQQCQTSPRFRVTAAR